jgi:hypothetical protein
VRVYTRKFDWDEARRLYDGGLSYAAIGVRLGVSHGAVYFALNEAARKRMAARNSQWQREGVCAECGTGCSRNASRKVTRCSVCANKRRATTVRENELSCRCCKEWKPYNAFPMGGNHARSGRHHDCRVCLTEAKRAWRERNRVPCSHGCGSMVDAKNRLNPDKPHECHSCAMQRIWTERRQTQIAA